MTNHLTNGRDTVGFLNAVTSDLEHSSLEDRFGRQNFQWQRRWGFPGLLLASGVSFAFTCWHGLHYKAVEVHRNGMRSKVCYAAAMRKALAERPTVSIVGPGNLGSALALNLASAGYEIRFLVVRAKKQASSDTVKL